MQAHTPPKDSCNFPDRFPSGKYWPSYFSWESPTDFLGALLTFLSMIPQGGFGALFADLFQKEMLGWEFEKRIPIDLIIFVASEEGKRFLVRSFNEDSFKSLSSLFELPDELSKPVGKDANGKDIKTFQRPSLPDALKLGFISLIVLSVAATFAGLTSMCFDGMTNLLREEALKTIHPDRKEIYNKIANWIDHTWLRPVTMGASLTSNLLGFSGPVRNLLGLGYNFFNFLFERHDYYTMKCLVENRLNAVHRKYITLAQPQVTSYAEDGQPIQLDRLNQFENTVFGFGDIPAAPVLRQNMLASAIQEDFRMQSDFQKHVAVLAGLMTVAICCAGFSNFYSLSGLIFKGWGEKYLTFVGEKAREDIVTGFSVADVIGMGALASTTYGMMNSFVRSIGGYQDELKVLTPTQNLLLWTGSFTTCVVGGAPNMEQSILAKQLLWLIITSGLASFLAEIKGMTNAILNYATKDSIKPYTKKSGKLKAATDLTDITPEDLLALHNLMNPGNPKDPANPENVPERYWAAPIYTAVTEKVRSIYQTCRNCTFFGGSSSEQASLLPTHVPTTTAAAASTGYGTPGNTPFRDLHASYTQESRHSSITTHAPTTHAPR